MKNQRLDDWAAAHAYPTGKELKDKLLAHYGQNFVKDAIADFERAGIKVSIEQLRRLIKGAQTLVTPWVPYAFNHWSNVIEKFKLPSRALSDPYLRQLGEYAKLIEHEEQVEKIKQASARFFAQKESGSYQETHLPSLLISTLIEELLDIDVKKAKRQRETYELHLEVQRRLKEDEND